MLQDGGVVTSYTPGESYVLRVRATHSGDPVGFGFQALAIDSNEVQAGNFNNAPAGTKITPLGGRQYPEQSSRSSSNTFEIPWDAPAEGTGDVSIYASVVIANGMSGSGGDGSAFLNDPVVLTELMVNTRETQLLEELAVFPNPASERISLSLSGEINTEAIITITNLQGQQVARERIGLVNGQQQHDLSVGHLASGTYVLTITDGQRSNHIRFVKQ